MKSSFRIPARVASFVHTVLLHFVILLIKIIQQAPKTYELKEEKQCPFWIFLIMQGNTHKDQDQQQQGNLSTLFPIICAATVFSVHKQKKEEEKDATIFIFSPYNVLIVKELSTLFFFKMHQ